MAVLTTDRMHTTRLRRLPMSSEGPSGVGGGIDPEIFETTWKTDNPGSSTDFQIQLPTVSGGTYDFHVDWGDGNSDDITVWNDSATLHTYGSIDTYTVQITGTFNGFSFNNSSNPNGGDREKLLTVEQWGVLALGNDTGHFWGCFNLAINATDAPVVGTTLESTFRVCFREFTGGVGNWDVSTVITMEHMFRSCTQFNEDLNDWNTSLVTNMQHIFLSCPKFNGNITSWNTAAVLNMGSMFISCILFNQDISGWTVTAVTDMKGMFSGALVFNQDIGSWNVGEVTDMEDMFNFAVAFNQDISSWNTAKVTNMKSMFRGITVFNQNIGGWDVDAVTNMQSMFQGATAFDQDIGGWDMVNKELMADFFKDAGISTTNYNALLIGWESTADGTPGINFNGGSSTYNSGAPATARASLITKSWTITDGGQV